MSQTSCIPFWGKRRLRLQVPKHKSWFVLVRCVPPLIVQKRTCSVLGVVDCCLWDGSAVPHTPSPSL